MMIYGSSYAKRRYSSFENFEWKFHSNYKTLVIYRCSDGKRWKACYMAIDRKRDAIIVGETLAVIKKEITCYFEAMH